MHVQSIRLVFALGWLAACGGSASNVQGPATPSPRAEGTAKWPTEGLPGADAERAVVPLEGAPMKGASAPLVTIVEFSDFQCPFCAQANSTLSQLLENFPQEVRIAFRHNPLPFHQQAVPAAIVSLEAQRQKGDAAFWRAHDILFEEQEKLSNIGETAELIERIRRELDLQPVADEDIDELLGRIQSDMDLAQSVGASGTPYFFINGRLVSGARPYNEFETVVREEIALAEAALKAGAARETLYSLVMEVARAQPAPREDAAEAPAAVEPNEAQVPRPGRPDPAVTYHVPVGKAPTHGPNDALVTIVTYSDFECPFCARVQDTLTKIREDYGGDIRVVFKNNPLPFHANARAAAVAALEAQRQGQDKAFWALHDKLFSNQQALGELDLVTYMRDLKLNPKALSNAKLRAKHEERIDAEQAEAKRLGALGTPSFFINGRFLAGAQPYEVFKALIDEEKAKAEKLVASGVPKKLVYAKTVADGAKEVEQPPVVLPREENYEIAIPKDAPVKGPAGAPVTVQIFSDFQCPFCSRVVPTLHQLEKDYRGKLRFVWHHYPLPFHENAPLAHEASVEVMKQKGSRAFWRFHDILFENQQELAADQLLGYAKMVGADVGKLRSALDSREHQSRVQADIAAVQAADMRIGTPTFLINGVKLSGAQPVEVFRAAIEQALAKTKK